MNQSEALPDDPATLLFEVVLGKNDDIEQSKAIAVELASTKIQFPLKYNF